MLPVIGPTNLPILCFLHDYLFLLWMTQFGHISILCNGQCAIAHVPCHVTSHRLRGRRAKTLHIVWPRFVYSVCQLDDTMAKNELCSRRKSVEPIDKAIMFFAHAQHHAVCHRGSPKTEIAICLPQSVYAYSSYMGLRWRLSEVYKLAFPCLSDFARKITVCTSHSKVDVFEKIRV